MDLSDEDVRAIVRLLDASAFDELDLETDTFKLSLRRTGGGFTREETVLGEPRMRVTPSAAPDAAAVPAGMPAAEGLLEVRTPLPGTFYRAPKPGAPPFVELGMQVEPQTVVAIVETMKLMNSIRAGVAGRVVEFCVGDGHMVAQHAVLLRVLPETP